jgi:FkbM family methyltransferase
MTKSFGRSGESFPVVAEYFRWSITPTYLAHLFKATFKQHHKAWSRTARRIIPEDGVVFDVGAHAGQYTKIFSRLAHRGRVFAFEPGSYARSILRVALYLNRCKNVAIIPMALGDSDDIAILTLPVKRVGSYGFGLAHLGANTRWSNVRLEVVAQTRIDRFVEVMHLDRLDFIKADIEGWEMHLVRGGLESIARFRPVMMVEMTNEALARGGDDLSSAYSAIEKLGYRPSKLRRDGGFERVENPLPGDIWWAPKERELV